MSVESLEAGIPSSGLLVLDTSAVLAYLAGSEPASPAAAWVLDECIATGRNAGALSMATVTETLVRPFRVGASAVAIAEQFLQHFGQMQLMDITYEIAREAARLRADSQLRTPDALILATALVSGASVVVTNDARWRNAAPKIVPELSICYLQDHLPL